MGQRKVEEEMGATQEQRVSKDTLSSQSGVNAILERRAVRVSCHPTPSGEEMCSLSYPPCRQPPNIKDE